MKLLLSKSSGLKGNTLLITVIVTGLVAFLMGAYLTLVRNQNTTTVRSQVWNSAIAVIEAGLEDALAHLNTHGTTNLAIDGWQLVNGQYIMQRMVGENYYIVGISNIVSGSTNSPAPVILSQGYVTLPRAASAPPTALLAAVGVPDSSKRYLGRGVRVNARRDALFARGLVARGQIDLKGNDITSDSFDSSNPAYSTNGIYDPSMHKDGGDIATNSGLTNSLNVGNADVFGKVSTGPGGSVQIGPSGKVGNQAWHDAPGNNGEIQPGWSTDDMNVNFPDVTEPFNGGGFTPNPGTVGGTSYTYVLEGENYQMSSLNLSGTEGIRVTSNAVLYVTGNVLMSGGAFIEISPGASLKLYVGGSSAIIGGNGIINNSSNALNFSYYGLTNNTSLSVAGNGTFIGTIYAPNAALTMNGSGKTETDVVGASVSKTVNMNGRFNFHYDEALRNTGPARGYVVTSWNEMLPSELIPPGTYPGSFVQ